jgi:CRISPR/Cas system-associated exonuclease Cas4 (RecB family)
MDERKGKPSASGMSRLALCAGSWNLESTLPDQEPNQYMQLGTDVHAVLAGTKEFDELTEEGQEIATRCLSDFSTLIAQLDLGERTSEVLEKRFWYNDAYSGAIDRIDFFGDVAVVTDYKTGRTAQGKASENQQLKSYAVLVKNHYPELKTIFVSIIQPLAGGTTIAEYTEKELEEATWEIIRIVSESLDPEAPRTPSPDACKWCRAKSICPEVQATHKELQVISGAVVNKLTNEELVAFDDKAEVVEDFIEEIRKEIKSRLLSGQQIAGYSLGKGRITRVISDADSARMQLEPIMGIVPFLRSCKISITALEKEYASATGLKLKEAKAELEDKLGWVIDTKESEPSIVRNK